MPDLLDESVDVSVEGIFNWILLLTIFSIITVVGNYVGYKHPIYDSLVGMGILSLITLVGVWLERKLPLNISSIIYISIIGIFYQKSLYPINLVLITILIFPYNITSL